MDSEVRMRVPQGRATGPRTVLSEEFSLLYLLMARLGSAPDPQRIMKGRRACARLSSPRGSALGECLAPEYDVDRQRRRPYGEPDHLVCRRCRGAA